MMTDVQAQLSALLDERKRLDALLDDALHQFALVEEDLNPRMKAATPAQLQELMAERACIEETLGIADLVDRIDQVRAQIARLKAGGSAAA